MKINYQEKLNQTIESLTVTPKLLLHSCCAPCSSYVLKYLASYFSITVYYYNPNIDTNEEFKIRSREQARFIEALDVPNKITCVIEDYNKGEFDAIAIGHEQDPEGGERCTECFYLRLRKTAEYAKANNFDYFTTTLSISPYKNSVRLNQIGEQIMQETGVKYLYADFKKNGGYLKSIELSKEYGLYRQDYCGCEYSKRDHFKRLEKRRQEQVVIPAEIKKEETKNLENTLVNNLQKGELKEPKNVKKDYQEQVIEPKKVPKTFKAFTIILAFLILSFPVKLFFDVIDARPRIETEPNMVNLNEFALYGRNLKLNGNIMLPNDNIKKVTLLFVGAKHDFEIEPNYKLEDNTLSFNLGDKINDGFLLENMLIDEYNLFLKIEDNENTIKYYSIDNQTKFDNIDYHSMKNTKVNFSSDKNYNTLTLNVEEDKTENVYDIVLDPGHGGSDPGACQGSICEINYTLDLANTLKKYLEQAGFKVLLTRDSNITIPTYGPNSRTGLSYESHAKFLLSIHLNAAPNTEHQGIELYTPLNNNYEFANSLINDLKNMPDFRVSTNPFNYVSPGIYTRAFTNKELTDIYNDSIKDKFEPFTNIGLDTNYYYIIRETGGYQTGAYLDGREGSHRDNPYFESNIGTESYILELGYIKNARDRAIVENYKEEYMQTIANTITNYLR